MTKPQPLRWKATIIWNFKDGNSLLDTFPLHEVEELHDFIEDGPNWDDIKDIDIKLEYQY